MPLAAGASVAGSPGAAAASAAAAAADGPARGLNWPPDVTKERLTTAGTGARGGERVAGPGTTPPAAATACCVASWYDRSRSVPAAPTHAPP